VIFNKIVCQDETEEYTDDPLLVDRFPTYQTDTESAVARH